MRYLGVLLGAVLLTAVQTGAQTNLQNIQLVDFPFTTSFGISASGGTAIAGITPSGPESEASATPALAAPELPAALPIAAEPPPQGVYGVFASYKMEAYAGYTFFRFYEVPSNTITMSGLNASLAYFVKDWLAVEGEGFAAFGSLSSPAKTFEFVGGGPRFRRTGPRNTEIWAHALAGYAHETPQTVFGSQNAFGYVLGGGVDINTPGRRFAYRISGDMVGTRFFTTYQYSPKFSVGIVYKF